MKVSSKKVSGKKVKNFRESKEMSREEVADSVGISSVHVGKIERGDCQPTVSVAYGIAEKLNVPLEELLEDKI